MYFLDISIRKELNKLLIIFITLIALLKISMYNENLSILFRVVISLFYLFIIPGYCIMYYWREKLDILVRIIIGSMMMVAIIGTISYLFGFFGFNVNYHWIAIPLPIILIFVYLVYKKKI